MGDAPPQEHLLVVLPFPELVKQLEDIRDKFPRFRVTYFEQKSHLAIDADIPKEVLASTTILCTLFYSPVLEEMPNLKLVQLISAGLDRYLDQPLVTESDINITNVSGIHGPPISEWVVMNWLVASRLYDKTAQWQREHTWPVARNLIDAMEDNVGKRVGILGYGSIGRQGMYSQQRPAAPRFILFARVAVAMGMSVLAYTFSPRTTPESRKDNGYIIPNTGDPDGTLPISWHSGADKASLHSFLSQNLDHLLISVPLTPSTTHFIGAEEMTLLSKSCKSTIRRPYLTNISRGKVIDQSALIESLKSGELSGAAIDVADPEPLPSEHPLWDAPNLQISPHVSSLGIEYMDRTFDVLKTNLGRLERGEELVNLYRRKKGY
ncbi:hypothetical protein FQN52_003600 [Onygenales sp. PD_12]|nr:hypothetical protein FQN52_003600 [Onygenales sp. PD_12]